MILLEIKFPQLDGLSPGTCELSAGVASLGMGKEMKSGWTSACFSFHALGVARSLHKLSFTLVS